VLKKRPMIITGIVLSALALVVTTAVLANSGPEDFAAARGLTAVGTVEGTEVDVNTKVPGRIVKILVNEGDRVRAGQVLAKISDDELKAKEAQAQALVEAAKSQLDQANQGIRLQDELSRSNIEKAEGALKAAQSQLDKARKGARNQEVAQAQAAYDLWVKTYQRVEKLYQKGAVPAQKLDEVRTQLEVAKQTLSMAKEGARQEDVKGAEAQVFMARAALDAANAGKLQVELARQAALAARAKYDQALAGLQEVQAYLKDTELRAPISGTVTSLNSDVGELVSQGMPVLTITDMENLWVEVKVRESDMGGLKEGQTARVKVGGPKERYYEGRIARIARKPDFAAKRATNDRGDQDILAYGVKVRIHKNKLPLMGDDFLTPGMTAEVKFED